MLTWNCSPLPDLFPIQAKYKCKPSTPLTLLLSVGMLMLLSTSSARYCSLLPRSHRLKNPNKTGTSRPPSCRTMAVRLFSLSDEVLPPPLPPLEPWMVLPPPPPPPCSDREKRVRRARAGTSPEAVGAVSKSRTRLGTRASVGLGWSAAAAPAAAAPPDDDG